MSRCGADDVARTRCRLPFHDALAKFFGGEDDPGTVKLLRGTK
jgi:hypothetical protein